MNTRTRIPARCHCLLSFLAAVFIAQAAWAAPGDVVISQIWGGNSVSSTVPNCDYIELFNRTGAAINMTGWSLNVATATGTAWAKLDLTGTIQPYSYYLVRVSATGTGVALPGEDAVFNPVSTSLSSTTGKACLRDTTTAIGAVACPAGNILDLVTYGTSGTCREGSANAPAGSTTGSGSTPTRLAGGCVDTNQNGSDFATIAVNPHWSGSPSTGGCTTGACCNLTTGVCTVNTSGGCTTGGGTYVSDGSTCPNAACPATGGCCSGTTGTTCTVLTPAGCAALTNGVYLTNGTTCTGTPCAASACCFANGTCCTLFSGLCIQQGGTSVTATTCSATGTCLSTTPPANDLCAGAIPVTLGTVYVSNNIFATSTGDGATVPHEATRATKGIWYRYTPSVTSVFTASACGSGFDGLLEVLSIGDCATPSTWAHAAGDDDKCLGDATEPGECSANGSSAASIVTGVALEAGQTYYFRVSLYGTTATGGGNTHFTLTDIGGTFGACCIGTSLQCELRSQAACIANGDVTTANGVYQGDGTTCTASLCGVKGACCLSGGICVTRASSACTGTSVYQGDDTTCYPEPCITEACCNTTSGACTIRTVSTCTTSETAQGADTVCSPSPCPPTGSCCNTDCTFSCTTTIQTACGSPSVWTLAGACTPTNVCNSLVTVPANDLPCNAIVLTLGNSVNGRVAGATTTDDGPDSTCQTAPGAAVWYKFQPASSGYYTVSTCGSTFDDVLTVLTGDCNAPAGMIEVSCDDDTCTGGTTDPVVCGTASSSTLAATIPFVYLDSSTNYFIRVSALATTTVGGTFPVVVNTVSAGACCSNTGGCTITLATGCTGTSVYQTDNSTCSPSPCPPGGSCCNTCTYACTTTLQASCSTSTSVWTLGGTCTAPTTCVQGAPPANDLPCDAITLVSGVSQTGTLFTATSTGDGLGSTCDTVASKGVWYKFTPGAGQGGDYTVSTCGSTFATCLTVMTGDCANPDSMTHVICDDDTCIGGTGGEPVVCGTGTSSTAAAIIPTVTLAEGTTYYVRIQVDTATATGAGTFAIVVVPAQSGACCADGGVCTDTISNFCTGGSVFFLGQTCGAGPCADVGACCATTFACTLTLASGCTGTSTFQGAGSSCGPSNPCIVNDNCPGPALALASIYFATNTGATPGAGTSPSCSISGCEDTWWDFTAPFADTFNFHCIQTSNGQPVISLWPDCSLTGELACLSGGRLSPTTPDITLPFTMTAGQHIKVRISAYACIEGPYTLEVNSTLPSGACCTGSTCSVQLASDCASGYQGNNSVCTTTTCTPPGVCCRGSTCSTAFTSAAACAAAVDTVAPATVLSKFVTGSATCNIPVTVPGTLGNITSPCCYANYNHNAQLEVQDIFDFLNDWFAGKKAAIVGGDGSTGTLAVQNIFDFLNSWFAGGCN